MKKFLSLILLGVLSAAVVVGSCGCEILEEAWEAGKLDSDNPNSEDYRPRFVVGIFSIVQYPRATELERPIRDLEGNEVYINANQNFSSRNLKDVKIVVRPGNPELCDLKFPYFPTQAYRYYLFVVCGELAASRFVTGIDIDVKPAWNSRN